MRYRAPEAGSFLSRLLIVGLVCATSLTLACASSISSRSVTAELRSEMPGIELSRSAHLKLGPVSMSLIRGLASLAEDDLDDGEAQLLAAIRRVEIDVYEVSRAGWIEAEAPMLDAFGRRLVDQGWTPVVTMREQGELGLVYANEDRRGRIRGMVVVSLEDDELAVIRLEGDLDEVLAAAIADDPDAVVDLLGNEL